MFNNEDSGKLLTNRYGDMYLYEVNGSAFNKAGSEAVYKQHFGGDLFKENALYILLGTDSGLLPRYLEKAGLPDGSYYIFIELPEVLERIQEALPDEGLGKKIILTTFDQWQHRAIEIEFQNYVYLNNMFFYPSIGAEDANLEGYRDVGRDLLEELEKLRWMLSAELGNEVFNIRQLENLAENRVPASCLKGLFSGKTAVVLGGGPSLDEVFPWLEKNREQVVVIAVSRIARRLLEVGLSPDIMVSIDPNPISFDISKEMLLLWERTLLVHMHHVISGLPGQWRGRNFFLGPRFAWESPLNEGILSSRGPTVTNTAISLALEMGVSQVLLAGVDLCFSQSGCTHAQGSDESRTGPQLGRGQLWIETNGGEMAETTPDLHFAITQIEAQAQQASERGCRLVNVGKDAARVPCVDYLPSGEVEIDPLPRLAFDMLLDQLPPDDSETRQGYYAEALAELDRAIACFEEVKGLSEEALEANAAFFDMRGKGRQRLQYKAKMDEIDGKLKSSFPDFERLFKQFGIRGLLKMTHVDQDKEWDQEDVDKLSRIYYEAYRDSAARLLEITENARRRLLTRIEEERGAPDFEALWEQWEKDKQPGRALVWLTRHPGKKLLPSVQARMEEFEKKFQAILDDQDTLHMKRTRIWSGFGQVRGKLRQMFKLAQRDHLEKLVGCLAPLEDTEAQFLFHLGQGYLAELDGDGEGALSEYLVLIDGLFEDQSNPILEDGLHRVLSISLDRSDAEHALLAARCLSGMSPVYLPCYADLLRLVGAKNEALDIYADYLEKVPDDLVVMLKLGRFYLELGIEEGARLMFDTVLEKDPANQAATSLLSELAEKAG